MDKKYLVMKYTDIDNYADYEDEQGIINACISITNGRINEEKTDNDYIVINMDEPYINEIIEVMKKHGHWDL